MSTLRIKGILGKRKAKCDWQSKYRLITLLLIRTLIPNHLTINFHIRNITDYKLISILSEVDIKIRFIATVILRSPSYTLRNVIFSKLLVACTHRRFINIIAFPVWSTTPHLAGPSRLVTSFAVPAGVRSCWFSRGILIRCWWCAFFETLDCYRFSDPLQCLDDFSDSLSSFVFLSPLLSFVMASKTF